MIVNETRSILNKHQIYAKKMFGQNFLIDKNVLEDIINYSGVDKTTTVMEIGPGLGTLTEYLAINCREVIAYEIDKDMIEILKDTLKKYDNIKIINQDFLKVDLNVDIKEYFQNQNMQVVANVPYYITTPILFKLLENKYVNRCLFMVQEEVGKRLTGKPNTKEYNALSVIMAYKTESKIVRRVGRNSFYPVPNVDSVLLDVKIVKNDYNVKNEPFFFEFVQAIFNQRRKTMINNLAIKYRFNKEELSEIFLNLDYNPAIRAEALKIDDIVKIYKKLFSDEQITSK